LVLTRKAALTTPYASRSNESITGAARLLTLILLKYVARVAACAPLSCTGGAFERAGVACAFLCVQESTIDTRQALGIIAGFTGASALNTNLVCVVE
jgi:hypothetical protein